MAIGDMFAWLPDGAIEGSLGGIVLGATCTAMLATTGKILGVSGIFDGALSTQAGQSLKVVFLSGLTVGGIVFGTIYPEGLDQTGSPAISKIGLVVSGLLVGLGTRLGNGCTSGHGLCGLPRLSRRSLVATILFMTSGVAAASVGEAWRTSGGDAQAGLITSPQAPSLLVRSILLGAALTGSVLTMARKSVRANWRAHLASMICGSTFAGGLVLSGMTKRSKIINFLALRRDTWDPSLLFVMGFGVMVTLAGFPFVMRSLSAPMCRRPATAGPDEASPLVEKFEVPKFTELDLPLVLGAWVFGVGWGMGGLCPGPTLVSSVYGLPGPALYFLPSMLVGMKAAGPLRGVKILPDPGWLTGRRQYVEANATPADLVQGSSTCEG